MRIFFQHLLNVVIQSLIWCPSGGPQSSLSPERIRNSVT
jgi:hypothetical protein